VDSEPRKPSLSFHDLSRTRKPAQTQHTLLPGITLGADQSTTSDTGDQEFTGHVFCDSSAKQQIAIETGAADVGWPLYATAEEATWNPVSQTLELRGHPAIQFSGALVESMSNDTVITLSPSKVNILGQTRTTLIGPP
jgi:hypothetical protein